METNANHPQLAQLDTSWTLATFRNT